MEFKIDLPINSKHTAYNFPIWQAIQRETKCLCALCAQERRASAPLCIIYRSFTCKSTVRTQVSERVGRFSDRTYFAASLLVKHPSREGLLSRSLCRGFAQQLSCASDAQRGTWRDGHHLPCFDHLPRTLLFHMVLSWPKHLCRPFPPKSLHIISLKLRCWAEQFFPSAELVTKWGKHFVRRIVQAISR